MNTSPALEITESLAACPVFSGLNKKHTDRLSTCCVSVAHRQGHVVFREGQEATTLYVLKHGRISLDMTIRITRESRSSITTIETISEPSIFGWSAVVAPYVYTLSARSLTDCEFLAVNGRSLRRVATEDPVLGLEVMKRLAAFLGSRLSEARLRLGQGLAIASQGFVSEVITGIR